LMVQASQMRQGGSKRDLKRAGEWRWLGRHKSVDPVCEPTFASGHPILAINWPAFTAKIRIGSA
jgi:hypothetical protein